MPVASAETVEFKLVVVKELPYRSPVYTSKLKSLTPEIYILALSMKPSI